MHTSIPLGYTRSTRSTVIIMHSCALTYASPPMLRREGDYHGSTRRQQEKRRQQEISTAPTALRLGSTRRRDRRLSSRRGGKPMVCRRSRRLDPSRKSCGATCLLLLKLFTSGARLVEYPDSVQRLGPNSAHCGWRTRARPNGLDSLLALIYAHGDHYAACA